MMPGHVDLCSPVNPEFMIKSRLGYQHKRKLRCTSTYASCRALAVNGKRFKFQNFQGSGLHQFSLLANLKMPEALEMCLKLRAGALALKLRASGLQIPEA